MNKKGSQTQANQKARHSCIDCGKLISRYGICCSACNCRHLWRSGKHTAESNPRGNKHYLWKGGRYKTFGGYIMVYNPTHHRASSNNYVPEHIFIWEEAHGKPIPDGWIIHHLNGIKHDNRPSNLVALPNNKHYLVLQAKAKRIQELEALLNHQGQFL